MSEALVQVDRVNLSYPVYEVTGRSLKLALMRQVVGSRIDMGVGSVEIAALNDISFELRPGDRLGLIGRNGSGKSTLLRLLARLAYPTSGRITIKGRVIPLIEKGLGINPELTGMENIELPLRLLGASTKEVRGAMETIPEFTGLGAFMRMPVRTYSEGMRARLAFAICTAIEGDVLVLDEWLGAGDIDFYERAQARLQEMLARTGIVVLATHALGLMEQLCNRVAWIDRGRLIMIGDTREVLHAYQSMRSLADAPVG
jgi:ABC-type polysaccharide/polyol phosphate transport system ATPase subunit